MKEATDGTNPLNPDTDGDGVTDGQKLQMELIHLNPDTDGDELLSEATNGTNLNPDAMAMGK
jgi:hypothetical protein